MNENETEIIGNGIATMPCNFIEITLRYGCSAVNSLHIFRTTFCRNTSGGLLLARPGKTMKYET